MTQDLISVIVPVYNAKKSLPACLESIMRQTYGNIEIILVDDGSADGSGKLCDEYAARDSRIKAIHKENGGPCSARNAALNAAKGDYIAFADSDDAMEKDMLEYLHNLAVKNNAAVSVCSYFKNGIRQKSIFNEETALDCDKALETLYPVLYIWNKLFSRRAAGKIRFNKELYVGEDMVFCLEAFKGNRIVYGPEAKYYYSDNPDGITKRPFNEKKLTYFNASGIMLEYAKEKGLSSLERIINNARTYHAIGFLRQLACSSGNGTENSKKTADFLVSLARKGILRYMFSRYKISSKMFGLAACINFNAAAAAYRFITEKHK